MCGMVTEVSSLERWPYPENLFKSVQRSWSRSTHRHPPYNTTEVCKVVCRRGQGKTCGYLGKLRSMRSLSLYRPSTNILSIYNYHHVNTVAVPVVMADSTTATSISLSWTTGGSEGVSYTVVWQRDTSGDCSDENEGSESLSGGSMTMYDIPELEEDST